MFSTCNALPKLLELADLADLNRGQSVVALNPLAQAVEHARHEDDHRYASFARAADDLRRIERVMKVNFTA